MRCCLGNPVVENTNTRTQTQNVQVSRQHAHSGCSNCGLGHARTALMPLMSIDSFPYRAIACPSMIAAVLMARVSGVAHPLCSGTAHGGTNTRGCLCHGGATCSTCFGKERSRWARRGVRVAKARTTHRIRVAAIIFPTRDVGTLT